VKHARLAALRAGDPDTVAEVLGELLPQMRALLHRLLGPGADVDDALQDALTELALALRRFEGRSSLATFAHRIAVRTAYRYFGRRRTTPLEAVPPPCDEIDPESRAMARQALRRLYEVLATLPDYRRVAFVLCAVEGMAPSEAAQLEGVSATAMRSRLTHARADVARLLGDDPYVGALLGRGGRR
jgi:RNA polymerase sigma factor (sigma-70 family)